MRVTSNTYTNLVISSSQSAQQQLATVQAQISTGNVIASPSDNPIIYAEASQMEGSLASLNNYTQAVSEATTATTANNSAMTSLHQILAQAGELATSVTSSMSTSDLQNLGTQMSSLLTQLTSVVNQKSADGNYLFGGTSNQQPLNPTTFAYNSSTNGEGATINVSADNPVQTGIIAGRPGTPATSGFLYDPASGVDVVASLKQAVSDLNSGNSSAVTTTDLPALNKALDLVASYVGSTAADMSAVSTASTQLQRQTTTQQDLLSNITQTNLPTASVQLQQLEMQYQASLEAGTRIMGMSILNYLGSTSP
jgi:flagellar hook-associated protein 3 FlgL